MNKRTNNDVFYHKLWGLMFPIVLQNLMLALVAVADAFMLGGMDQNYMSAVSLATQIQFIQNMFLSAAALVSWERNTGEKVMLRLWTRFSAWHCGFVDWYQ